MDKDEVLFKMAAAIDPLAHGFTVASAALMPPVALGYLTGLGHGQFIAPMESDLKRLHADYVTAKMQEAIEELETKKRIELAKEKLSGPSPTLRF